MTWMLTVVTMVHRAEFNNDKNVYNIEAIKVPIITKNIKKKKTSEKEKPKGLRFCCIVKRNAMIPDNTIENHK